MSKRYKKLLELSKDRKKAETLEEAIKKVKQNCTTKFDESIDISLNLNLKKKKEETNIRTVVNLPNGNGKKIKVAVLCEESKTQEAKDSGAEIVANIYSEADLVIRINPPSNIEIDGLKEGSSLMIEFVI